MSSKHGAQRLGLQPMRPLDLAPVKNTADLLQQMSNTAFTGRALGEALDVAETMLRDDCLVVLTLTGAMTMAGLNRLLLAMIDRRWVHCIVSTGALVGHGLVEDLGLSHYKTKPGISDEQYLENRLNRVYDTVEAEDSLDAMEEQVRRIFDHLADTGTQQLGTAELLAALGRELDGTGVLQRCAANNVPVFIPAFTDSELGLDFAVHQSLRQRDGQSALAYDGFADLRQFTELCRSTIAEGRKLAIFTIGGGVPRNWAQQVGPYTDILDKRLGKPPPRIRYSYGVRICPDPVHYGHLSGCTYSEGVSWGKFVPPAEGGRYAEVLLDATVGWPLLVQGLIDRFER